MNNFDPLYYEELKYMVSTKLGRRFLWRQLVERFRLLDESCPLNANAYAQMALRQQGLSLLADLKDAGLTSGVRLAEDEYNEMMKETKDERRD